MDTFTEADLGHFYEREREDWDSEVKKSAIKDRETYKNIGNYDKFRIA